MGQACASVTVPRQGGSFYDFDLALGMIHTPHCDSVSMRYMRAEGYLLAKGDYPARRRGELGSAQAQTSERLRELGEESCRATDAREKGRIGITGSNWAYAGSSPRVTSDAIGRDINPLGRGDGNAYVGGALNLGRIAPEHPASQASPGTGSSINNCGQGGCGGAGNPRPASNLPEVTPDHPSYDRDFRLCVCKAHQRGYGQCTQKRSIGDPIHDPVCCDECDTCYLSGTYLVCAIGQPAVIPLNAPVNPMSSDFTKYQAAETISINNGQPSGEFRTKGVPCCRTFDSTASKRDQEMFMEAEIARDFALNCLRKIRSKMPWWNPFDLSSIYDCMIENLKNAEWQVGGCCDANDYKWLSMGHPCDKLAECCSVAGNAAAIACRSVPYKIVLCPDNWPGGTGYYDHPNDLVFGNLCMRAHILLHEVLHKCGAALSGENIGLEPVGNSSDEYAKAILEQCGCKPGMIWDS